ncbi:unnamed protein product, partial [Phaeothamnion confervicola]
AAAALLLGGADGFRIAVEGDSSANASHFIPYDGGFVARRYDPVTATREGVNEGANNSEAWPNVYGTERRLNQRCPGRMVGPMGDGQFYCTSPTHGFCDRRSGDCFCSVGYTGSDCSLCLPSHFSSGGLCYPKKLCPGDCSGAGDCDVKTGVCRCSEHRTGDDCGTFLCAARFDARCSACTAGACVACGAGFSLSSSLPTSNCDVCLPCARFDPRCAVCDADRCLRCADPLLLSTRRSGRRVDDAPLPADEETRQLTRPLPFGSQDPLFFADAEDFWLVGDSSSGPADSSGACAQGDDGDATWRC